MTTKTLQGACSIKVLGT